MFKHNFTAWAATARIQNSEGFGSPRPSARKRFLVPPGLGVAARRTRLIIIWLLRIIVLLLLLLLLLMIIVIMIIIIVGALDLPQGEEEPGADGGRPQEGGADHPSILCISLSLSISISLSLYIYIYPWQVECTPTKLFSGYNACVV